MALTGPHPYPRWYRLAVASLFCAACGTPSAPLPSNSAPTVTIAFVGPSACSPLPGAPCSLTVSATGVDPEGGPLMYRWSGCAAGAATQATCLVQSPGNAVASVEVTDAAGLSTSAQLTGTGTNEPPQFEIGYTWVGPGGGSVMFLGAVRDPEQGLLWGREYCVSASTAGACEKPVLSCPTLTGPELTVLRAAPTGICEVTVDTKDDWNRMGTSVVTFDVNNPAAYTIAHKRD